MGILIIAVVLRRLMGMEAKGVEQTFVFLAARVKRSGGVNDLEEKLISMESKIDSRPADTGNGIRDEGRTKR